MVLGELCRGGLHEFFGEGIEVHEIVGVGGGGEESEGIEVGGGGFFAIEVVDELVDEIFFVGSDRDADVFDGDECPFFGDDEVDEGKIPHGAPDIGAGGDDDGAVLGGEEIVGAEVGIDGHPVVLFHEEIADRYSLGRGESILRAEEIIGRDKDGFDGIVDHADAIVDEAAVVDETP